MRHQQISAGTCCIFFLDSGGNKLSLPATLCIIHAGQTEADVGNSKLWNVAQLARAPQPLWYVSGWGEKRADGETWEDGNPGESGAIGQDNLNW